ncbi:MAG: YceI family protein [Anaerolineales bacterium]|nr:YceI family protein [Anaerolineales bacterium]
MRPLTLGLLGLALVLAACAPAAPTESPATATLPTPTSAPATIAPTAALTDTPIPVPVTELPSPTAAAPSGIVPYAIDPSRTTVQYSVEETFLNDNNRLATAIGRTSEVRGTLKLNFDDPAKSEFGEFTVDISTLRSDSSRRDNAIRRRWLESATYPIATFVVRSVEGFPPNPQPGQDITFKLVGDLTVRTTTRTVTWDVTARLDNETLSGTATTFIMMADFGVEPPSIAGILRVKDGVTLTLNFVMLPTQ